MKHFKAKKSKSQVKISHIEATQDNLTDRAGMLLFSRYLEQIGILSFLCPYFMAVRTRNRGVTVHNILKQIICFLADGTRRHLTYFDSLKQDEGYASMIEMPDDQMMSSHSLKRFVSKLAFMRIWGIRRVLKRIFIRQLNRTKPDVIELGIDTMVMDNDDAPQKEAVKPTYKKVKGFQPLQMYWNDRIVDAVFRGGDKHSNHSDTTEKMIVKTVSLIRRKYRDDVPIIIRMDSGFFDQKIFTLCEKLHVGYICGGKQYKDIKEYISGFETSEWTRYTPRETDEYWEYIEFKDRRESWKTERRSLYCRHRHEASGQQLLEFARRDTVIYTNLGVDEILSKQLNHVNRLHLVNNEEIIQSYHQRALDELTNRSFKEFHSEKLPFFRFESNMFWYFMMVLSFFIFQDFRDEIVGALMDQRAYPTTLRRHLFDRAGKIVSHAGKLILKVPSQILKRFNLPLLWKTIHQVVPVS